VTGRSGPFNGQFAVVDPRPPREIGRYQPYGVVGWNEPGRTVTGEAEVGAGPYSVADPRLPRHDADRAHQPFGDIYPVTKWNEPAGAVTSGRGVPTIADPRLAREKPFNDVFRVVRWDEAAGAITAGGTPSAGGQAIADPRVASKREDGEFASARHYGVLRWNEASGTITGSASHDNGAHSVADPRDPREKCAPWIWSLDGTRHRPLTTLDLIALQGFPPEDILGLRLGGSDAVIREHVGNAVPVASAEGIGSTMLHTLLLARLGQSFALSTAPIWVDRPTAIALSAEVR
jgi:site-specific DNA-cytosine methylase